MVSDRESRGSCVDESMERENSQLKSSLEREQAKNAKLKVTETRIDDCYCHLNNENEKVKIYIMTYMKHTSMDHGAYCTKDQILVSISIFSNKKFKY